jgi:CheY-like chemotaxis protein
VGVALQRDASSIAIRVSDTGSGIPADKLDLIFEEFQQLRPDGKREGLGLGLAIVRQLVKLLGVELKMQSAVGKGTSFTVIVPLASQQGAPEESPESGEPAERSASILLIDDEAPVRNATALFLGLEGHRVVSAASPEEALAKWHEMEQAPDVIVSDYQLGTPMNGADLIEQLRSLARRTIPAIVMSGDMLRVARRCASIENCRVFHKPIDAEELAQQIRAIMIKGCPLTESH